MTMQADLSKREKAKLLADFRDEPAPRLPLPAAYADPAFFQCLLEAAITPELVQAFDRLSGNQVSRIGNAPAIVQMVDRVTGFQDEQMREFAEFVHDSIYMRLDHVAIHAFRAAALLEAGSSA